MNIKIKRGLLECHILFMNSQIKLGGPILKSRSKIRVNVKSQRATVTGSAVVLFSVAGPMA